MTTRLLRGFATCAVITLGIAVRFVTPAGRIRTAICVHSGMAFTSDMAFMSSGTTFMSLEKVCFSRRVQLLPLWRVRGCGIPPEKNTPRAGTQITLRFSFNSHGRMISEPRTTYVSADTPPDVREVYWNAATAALKRCTPLQFTDGLGGALAGRPFAVRFVDNRSF